MTILTFDVNGLNCGACAARAEKAVSAVAGVRRAEVNFATHGAVVEVADAGVTSSVTQALAAAGYPAVPNRIRLQVTGMTCASCVARVEAALRAVAGVTAAHVNLADNTARVTAIGVTPAELAAAVSAAGYSAQPLAVDAAAVDQSAEQIAHLRRATLLAALLTLPIFIVEMGGHIVPEVHHYIARTIGLQNSWLMQFVLATAVLAGPGRGFFLKGFPALMRRVPDMNSLVALGAGAAWVFSTVATFRPIWLPDGTQAVYYEAAAVIVTLILMGRLLEARAKGRTGAAIRRLIGLRPDVARVERDGVVVELSVDQVQRGDRLHLRPGERVPVDGVIREGTGFFDESMITGEPLAAEKVKGDAVVAGTVNGNSALVMRATAVGADTMLSRIIAMVAEAQGARLPMQDLVNRITLWFVPAVMAVALVTVVAWFLLGPAPALPFALVAGVSVLIIACPCAMGLATPTSIMVGTGRAAELGVLFRRGDALQALQGVQVVAFDKTGTLTQGKPEVTDVDLPDDVLAMVAAVEAVSEHPLAGAIIAVAKARGLVLPSARDVQAVPGHGLIGMVGARRVVIGNGRMLAREAVADAGLLDQAAALATKGRTPVLVAVDGKPAGVLGIADQVKPSARGAVAALQAQGLEVAMISGDAKAAAQAIADELGITRVIAEVLPEEKVSAVRALQEGGRKVAFVGDGINDAPALVAADVGVAMGTGTDVAVESADVVLVSGNPAGVVQAIEVSRRTLRNIHQNLVWAFGYNVLLIPVAMGLLYPVWGVLLSPQLAALAMAASSVLVVANALRLRWVRAEVPA